MQDIVFPKGNEQQFIDMAKRVGYDELCMVYPLELCPAKPPVDKENKLNITLGILLKNEKDLAKSKGRAKKIFMRADDTTRVVMEKSKGITFFGFELDPKSDKMHQRRSGLNHIMCAIAERNDHTIGFSFSQLLTAKPHEKKRILGRIAVNLMLAKKYKNKALQASFASEPYHMRPYADIKSFFGLLH